MAISICKNELKAIIYVSVGDYFERRSDLLIKTNPLITKQEKAVTDIRENDFIYEDSLQSTTQLIDAIKLFYKV
ncbi:hypothetical protein ACTXT7_007646 [Hymenolepis weldensis]